MEPRFFDTHCHLDLMLSPDAAASESAALGLGLFDCGVDPRDFAAAKKRASRYPNIIAGIGLHPWWLADGRCGAAEINLLCKVAAQERFIGEVGLDFSARCAGSEPLQTQALDQLCNALVHYPLAGRVISIHAVRSAGTVLDALESYGLLTPSPNSPAIIFHWFSGTSDELVRARNAGCYFSVNERMLASKRGREYTRQIPLDRLLLETDAPAEPNTETSAQSLIRSLTRTSERIASLKKCDIKHIESAVLANARSVF
ncbi:TatD family deoxyribonuclease [Collinsella sp. AF29-7AC]|uniref:TatD family hydrolase n=1 Tax=Collinsella sp. AF29-7AC TaxID=2292010 RepID=UPI000E479FFA|nr:TatD family hydrolase [Collinsella sp. AF29-7AC]RHN37998.1 TatD family deoxyribonuclease [Collinsella sp. AF29-7AC]